MEEVGFVFAEAGREGVRFVEQSYSVRVDGADQQLAVSAEVTCWGARDSGGDGCAAAPGALGAAGVVLLVGAVALERRP